MENRKLHGVTPLFAAALKNDVKLVRYLIGKGANVSSRTSTENKNPFSGITPLHAALLTITYINSNSAEEADSWNQTEVIRILLESGADQSALSSDGTPTWMFSWIRFYENDVYRSINMVRPNVSAISLLLEYGMSINQRCPRFGQTLLHYMAGPANKFDDDDKIVNLLLEKGADFRVPDREGITPILSAAIGNNEKPNISILKFFMEREEISNMDKIEALEMAVAVFLGNDLHSDIEYCLSGAQELRKIEGVFLIPKISVNERAVEWATSSRLETIQQWRSELEIQSILIRLRIFSAMNWGAIYRYLWPYVFDCINSRSTAREMALLTFNNNYDDDYRNLIYPHVGISRPQLVKFLDISWTMLEIINRFAPTTSDVEEIRYVINTIVDTLSDALSGLKRINDHLFNAEVLKTSFELLSTTLQSQFIGGKENPPLTTIKGLGKMFSFLVDLPDVMIEPISDYLKEIVNLNNQAASNQEKLILACIDEDDYTMISFRQSLRYRHDRHVADVENSLDFIRFLLRFGADPDAVDGNGNGAPHILAAKLNGELITNAIALLLLDSGAHLDRANKNGMTAADVWKQERKRWLKEDQKAGEWQDLPDWLRRDVPKLMCLSVRIIRSHRIPYLKVLPPFLQSFVSFH